MTWTEFAACRDVDPELFFPAGVPGAPGYDEVATAARFVCSTCPVRPECLRYALDAREVGVWGGTDEAERWALRRAARATVDREDFVPVG